MTSPRAVVFGASSRSSRAMRAAISRHGFSWCPMAESAASPEDVHISFMGVMACRASFTCTTSRGVMRPAATFDTSRSRSPMRSRRDFSSSLSSGLRKKCSTMSRRPFMALTSFSGNSSQRLSMRAPIGDTVRSMTSSRLLPSSAKESISSRLRTVNRSRRTYRSSSMREMELI